MRMPFSLERPVRYLYEYAYQEEECWCTRKEEYSSTGFLSESMVFSEEKLPPEGAGYIRLCVRRVEDGNDTIKWDALPDWPEEVLEVRGGMTEADFRKQEGRACISGTGGCKSRDCICGSKDTGKTDKGYAGLYTFV